MARITRRPQGKDQGKKQAARTPEDLPLLEKFHKWLQNAIDDQTWVAWRKHAIKCYMYRENEQWTSSERGDLEKRKQPETINNQVSVTVARQVGQFVKLKVRTAFAGRNSVDDDSADILSELFLYVRQNTKMEFEERDVFEDGTISGYGVFDVGVSFDDLLQPEITVERENPFDVLPDPKSRKYDWNEDAQYIFRVKWVDLKDAQERFPGKATMLNGLFDDATRGLLGDVDVFRNNNFINQDREQLKIAEVQYKVKEKQVLLIFPDGSTILKQDADPAKVAKAKSKGTEILELDRLEDTLWQGTFTAGVLLEHKKLKRKMYRWVPYFVHRKQNGEPFSEIFIALPMQDAINKRESKALHLLTTNQSIYEEGAIEDKGQTALEIARPDGQIEVARGFFEKFKLEKNVELAQAQMQMHTLSQTDFKRIVGINPESLGERSEIRSGAGIREKVQQTELILLPNFSNFTRTRSIMAFVILDLMKIYYTEPKLRFITDDQGARKKIALGRDTIESIKQNKYDVLVTVRPDVESADQEQFNQIREALPGILPFGPFWVQQLLELSDIPKKKELIEKLNNVPPPPLQPKINISAQIDQLTPPERAFYYRKMGDEKLAQIVEQTAPPPTNLIKKEMQTEKTQAKLSEEDAKLQAKAASDAENNASAAAESAAKAEEAALKAESEAQKGQADIFKSLLDIDKKQIEVRKAQVGLESTMKKEKERVKGTNNRPRRNK